MQHLSYEECREIEKTHVCTECRSPLVTAWDGKADQYAIRCGIDPGHEGFTRVKSLSTLRKEGVKPPIEVEQQFQRKEHREMLEHIERGEKALTALLPREDAGNSKPLSPAQALILVDYAEMIGLNPYLQHVDFYFGIPRVTIYGRYYHARRQPTFYVCKTRPLALHEREEQRLEDHVHAWIAEVIDTSQRVIATGFGYSQDKEEGQLMKGVSESWATPQRRAEKRAEEDALGKAFPIGIGVVEEGGAEGNDVPTE